MNIKQRDYDLLNGLHASGHAYIAAGEAEDALRLAGEGLVKIWSTVGGFSAWTLTDLGRAALRGAGIPEGE